MTFDSFEVILLPTLIGETLDPRPPDRPPVRGPTLYIQRVFSWGTGVFDLLPLLSTLLSLLYLFGLLDNASLS